ncbi:hypothetical protein KSF_065470 [Reticulibacter mediterranei]|uniref:Uncharacterized protein n=1 Tax=Reticulibacter mediterranei TaxID=2778369 RepID=A0A8J3IR90_9CHLR|nr:hypothetical protein [Reticulibacter mediterranei]GHO96499.1 hypothetical protein KSF_065470 [Reticulibacter mediterranei]
MTLPIVPTGKRSLAGIEFFPQQLIITEESEDLSGDADILIREYFS